MLTDYHVHLRPDEDDTTPEAYFTTANAERYRESREPSAASRSSGWPSTSTASRSRSTCGATPGTGTGPRDDLDAYCEFVREETDLRLGIEADFLPGREDRLANLLDGRPWDYVVGSLHFLSDEAVDLHAYPDWESWDIWRSHDPEKVWTRYFETLGEAARSGLFDILAHPDLVKVWGERVPRPEGDLRRFYERAMDGIAESDVAIEVSTAGLRKPVAEIYPAAGFLELCLEAGRPVALSSDAHVPEQLGHEYERTRGLAARPRRDRAGRLRGAPPAPGAARMSARSGIGFDSHRFEDGRRLVLGGVEVPWPKGLAGHSDADALAHAVTDALLGAAGLERHRRPLPRHRRALARRRQHRAAQARCGPCSTRRASGP